jgi:hypothetical protein
LDDLLLAKRAIYKILVASGAAMKSWKIITSILILACVPVGAVYAKADHRTVRFPAKGTPYADARASLLKQGLVITRERRSYSSTKQRVALRKRGIATPEILPPLDRRFPEIDCWKTYISVNCRALFLETDKRGWRGYVVVDINPKDKTVTDIRYPYDVEGLPSIPGPLAHDVPQLKGSYLKARNTLRALEFLPARNHDSAEVSRVCSDKRCDRVIALPEAQCAGTGMAPCLAYWISPNNRVLRINTMGEHPQVYFVEWSTWKDLRRDFGK